MRAFHIVLGILLFLILAGGAGFLLVGALQGSSAWQHWVDIYLKSRHLHVVMLCCVVLCLLLLYALTGINVPGKVQYLAYDSEGGAVSISLVAVEGFLARLSGEFAAVTALEPKLRLINNQVDVQLDIKVRSGTQIPVLCKMLQESARNCLRDKVGISDIRDVRVRVQEIVGGPGSGSTSHGDKPAPM